MIKKNEKPSRDVKAKVEKKPKIKSWKIIAPVAIIAILAVSLVGIYLFLYQKPGLKTWTVDDDNPADFSSIQRAINSTNAGDTILVKAGTYYESYIEIKKPLTLSGENKSTTIIDGKEMVGAVIAIKASNVNLSGFTIRNGAWGTAGIYLGDASGCIVKDNLITSNVGGSGIDLFRSNNNNASGNIIESNGRGIELEYSSNNDISNNTILSNSDGIYLAYASSNNTFSGNTVMNNSLHGFYYYSFYGDKPCDNNALIGNTIGNNSRGARFEHSNNNMIIDNVIANNSEFGVGLFYSSGSFVGNRLSNNGEYSISVTYTSGNNISKNIFSDSEEGIDLYGSSNNTIKENTFLYNQYALYVWVSSNNNLVYNNTISNNTEGVHISYSSDNIIYHNNFVNNTIQVNITGSINTWDDGYPSGGNYWSDHVSTGNPSNGSQPYIIDADNIDHYPFQDPNGWMSLP